MVGRQTQMMPVVISAALMAVNTAEKVQGRKSNIRPEQDHGLTVGRVGAVANSDAYHKANHAENRCALQHQ